MYEKITAYANIFEDNAVPKADLPGKIESFSNDFMQSGFMVSDAMEAMGERAFAGKEALKKDAPTMTAEEVCICLSAFIQQEAFIPGILLDLVQQGVIPALIRRLKELDV